MGFGIIDTSTLTAIANAIRTKLGVQTTYKPSEMPEAIEGISGGGITPAGTKSITANGTYDVASYASAEVNVPSSGITPTGTKQISITANGTVTEDVTAYADAEISVNVPTGITPAGTKQVSITANGMTTEDVTSYANAQISVNVVNQDYEDALVALGVTEDLADSIEALTTYANGVTGESDTTLSDAVHTLGSGYGGGSGLEYEEGTYTAVSDGNPTINFANSHTKEPSIVVFMKTNTSETMPNNCGTFFANFKVDDIFGSGLQTGVGLFRNNIYAQAHTSGSGSTSLNAAINTDNTNPIITSSSFKPYFSSTTYVCKTGETYKWIAIWK